MEEGWGKGGGKGRGVSGKGESAIYRIVVCHI